MTERNADLYVQTSTHRGMAGQLRLESLTRPEDLTSWEYAAYEAYGEARCDAEGIQTIGDLFGPVFEAAFRARHEVLLAQDRLATLQNRLRLTLEEIALVEAIIARGGRRAEGLP